MSTTELPTEIEEDVPQAELLNEFDAFVRFPSPFKTMQEYREWAVSDSTPHRARVELVNGIVEVDMTREEINYHATLKLRLTTAMDVFVTKHDLGKVFPDGVSFTNEPVELGTSPDLMFAKWETIESGQVTFPEGSEKSGFQNRAIAVEGAPDLVIELVSVSSRKKDKKVKRESYAKAGIPEYWIIHASHRGIEFSVLNLHEGQYVDSPVDSEGKVNSAILGAEVQIQEKTDRAGMTDYTITLSHIQ
ncbi:Uma2 family endonuclease [Calycomorphotria hydatis]|uniref:Putative restriction endonuclease domain-containing protein n=1 Tax=Calycomorphotria hydatis TaxID=2528027 RepID=A0A517TCE1_9PLAN|nr:Uma2 family endonuclease [Calycomorphotria hydatis]QDT66036.1 hypothetical protein V22_33000 [Calycomorphotria hydatis]